MISLSWEGVDDVLSRLRQLPPRLAERALKPAVDKAARLVSRSMKAHITRRRTGLLKASIGVRVKARWGRGVFAVIGPRRSVTATKAGMLRPAMLPGRRPGKARPVHVYAAAAWRRKRDFRRPEHAAIKPSRYAHLVEKGHGGRAPAPAYPFMAPTRQATMPQAQRLAADELRKNVSKIIAM